MLTKTDAAATADSLLAKERAASPAIQRRVSPPQWFLDAPDGLDAPQKLCRFEELRESARKATGLGTVIAMGLPAGVFAGMSHLGAPVRIGVMVGWLALVVGVRLARGPLLTRMLRLHVKTHATW